MTVNAVIDPVSKHAAFRQKPSANWRAANWQPADWQVQALAGTAVVVGTTGAPTTAGAAAGAGADAGAGAAFGLGLDLAARCAAFFLRSIQRPRRCRFTRGRNCCPISGVQYGKLGRTRQVK